MLQYPLASGGLITRVLEVLGEGTPFVLLHGAGARADRWRSSLEFLAARGVRALAMDLPGHGLASKGDGPDYSVRGFAQFVGDVLDELDIAEAVLVGTSLGAHVLARLAIDRRGLAKKLVLVGPTGVFPLGQDMRGAIAANLRDRSRDGIRRKLGRVVAQGAVDEAWVTEEYRINSSPGADESFQKLAEYVDARLDDDGVASALRAGGCDCPLMVVWGENDTVVPIRTREDVEAACGPADVALIPDAGHLPYAENTEAFWKCVLPFVGE